MATQPKVGALAGLILERHASKSDVSGLVGLMLISEAEGSAPVSGDPKVSGFAGLLLETQVSNTRVPFLGGLLLVSSQELVLLDATGNLLSQSQY